MPAPTKDGQNAPLFLLAPPRSFTSIICAMLGQHPQMYGLPELHLFGAKTLAEWSAQSLRTARDMDHGLLRAVAQLYFGEQTERSVLLARGWLRRRACLSTGYVFELLAEKVHPKIPVDKSPTVVYSVKYMRRSYQMFPHARFIHLVRHPRSQGESVMKRIRLAAMQGPVPKWMTDLASFPIRRAKDGNSQRHSDVLDPQYGWLSLNMNICDFLKFVPEDQKIRIRGEDVVTYPDRLLREIAGWLELRTDSEAIEEMKHPERSPYACFGPPGASIGNDRFFLRDPVLRSNSARPQVLEGPLQWREDGLGFLPEVNELARHFGYR